MLSEPESFLDPSDELLLEELLLDDSFPFNDPSVSFVLADSGNH